MPENLLAELQLQNDFHAAKFFLLIGDILHFAAIAYVILFLVSRLLHYAWWSLVIAVAIMISSPYVWDLQTGITAIDHVITLFNGHPPETFFPIFPWLVYPLCGLSLGYFLKHNNHNYLLKQTGILGIAVMILSFCFPATIPPKDWLAFYRTEPADTLFHLGFVLMWLGLFNWLFNKIPGNPMFRLFSFCSRNITSVYIIQWMLICWCLAFTGYLQLNMINTLLWMTGITTVTLLFTHALHHAYRKSI